VWPALERDTVAQAEIVNAGSTIAFVDVDVLQIPDDVDAELAEIDEAMVDEHGVLVATGKATYSTKNAKPEAGPDDLPIG
jgi:acyl-coenzyme A thioesterase PaaI-like protein